MIYQPFFFSRSVHVSPLGDSRISAGSGLLRGDMTLQAKQADKALVVYGGDLRAVLCSAARCQMSAVSP